MIVSTASAASMIVFLFILLTQTAVWLLLQPVNATRSRMRLKRFSYRLYRPNVPVKPSSTPQWLSFRRQPLADGDDGHGPVDAQSAKGQRRAHMGAVPGNGALLNPSAQALRRQSEVEGKQRLLSSLTQSIRSSGAAVFSMTLNRSSGISNCFSI